MRARATLGTLLLLAAALGCGSSESEALVGPWYLQSYNDSAMPGTAVFRSANDSDLIGIDSVRLVLDDASACSWLVHLTGTAPTTTNECVWTLDAGPDDILVTILVTYTLQGSATADDLRVTDPSGNHLVFGREPAERDPFEPQPGALRDVETGAGVSRVTARRGL
jgi:hypothetical protein